MNQHKADYTIYLQDILTAMSKIQRYIKNLDFNSFEQNDLVVDAVIRNFEIIGEAAKLIPESLKQQHPEVPWQKMYRLRNLMIHDYASIDYHIVWKIATEHLPYDYNNIRKILTPFD